MHAFKLDILLIFFLLLLQKGTFFWQEKPLLCGGYALFWSGFDADFEDFVQISAQKMLAGSSVYRVETYLQKTRIYNKLREVVKKNIHWMNV